MASSLSDYGNGVIQEECPSCKAPPNKRCKPISGNIAASPLGPHKARMDLSKRKKEDDAGTV